MIVAADKDRRVGAVDVHDVPQPEDNRLCGSCLLSDEERQALRAAMLPARPVRPHTDLVRESECAGSLFVVVDGWACRYTITGDGARQLSAVLISGDVGNFDSLLFDRLGYGLRTITHTMVAEIPRERALALAARYPGIARTFIWLALVDHAVLTKWAQSLARRSSIERLAHLLCELSVRLGADTDSRSSFAFPLTQEQLADMLGLTPVHINRTMQQLRRAGLVVIAKKTITLPDVRRLRRIGGFNPNYLNAVPCATAQRV